MTVNAIEKALWLLSSDPEEVAKLQDDTKAYLGQFRIDDEERDLLESWEVNTLAARGVNPMLLMMAFGAVNGMGQIPEYVERIHQPPGEGA